MTATSIALYHVVFQGGFCNQAGLALQFRHVASAAGSRQRRGHSPLQSGQQWPDYKKGSQN